MRTFDEFTTQKLDENILTNIGNSIKGAVTKLTGGSAKAAEPPKATPTPKPTPKKPSPAEIQRAYGVTPRTSDGRGTKDATGLPGMKGPKSNQVGSVNRDQQARANRAGWQSSIKKAEHGTDHDNVYTGRFGSKTDAKTGEVTHRGSPVDPTKSHTGEKVKSPWSDRTSAAAGAYQAMPDTWRRFMGNAPMTPANQDKFADKEAAGAGVDLKSNMTSQRVSDLAPKWASFPDKKTGKSVYGQPSKPYSQIRRNFDDKVSSTLGRDYEDAPGRTRSGN